MGMKAGEVGNWLRQHTGRRDHHEVLRDDYLVVRPGPNFDWLMSNLGIDQPTPAAPEPEPEPDPASDDRRQDDSRPQ